MCAYYYSDDDDYENLNMVLKSSYDIRKLNSQDEQVAPFKQYQCKQKLPKFLRIIVYSYLQLKILAIKIGSMSLKERQIIEKSSILLDGELRLPDINTADDQFYHHMQSLKKFKKAYQDALILRMYNRVNIFLPSKQDYILNEDIYNHLTAILNKIDRKVTVDICAYQWSKDLFLKLLKFRKVKFNEAIILKLKVNLFEFNCIAKAFKTIEMIECDIQQSPNYFPKDKISQYRLRCLKDNNTSHLDDSLLKFPEFIKKIFSKLEDLKLYTSSKIFTQPYEFNLELKCLKTLRIVFIREQQNDFCSTLLSCLSQVPSLQQLILKLNVQSISRFSDVYDFLCDVLSERQQQDLVLKKVEIQIPRRDQEICLHYLLDKISLLQGKALNQLIIRIGKQSKLLLMSSLFKVYQYKQYEFKTNSFFTNPQKDFSVKSYDITFVDGSQRYKNKYDFTVQDQRLNPINRQINIVFSRIDENKMGPKIIEVSCYGIGVF